MPTASQLLDAGRGDLCQAIVQRGGFIAAGQALGWGTQRRQRSLWVDAAVVAAELRQFILASQFSAEGSGSCIISSIISSNISSNISSSGSMMAEAAPSHTSGGAQQDLRQDQQHEVAHEAAGQTGQAGLPAGARMPTHCELARAGRHDLR